MGNSPSAVAQRVEHGSKTGVCSLRELKLEQVNTDKCSYTTLRVAESEVVVERFHVLYMYG